MSSSGDDIRDDSRIEPIGNELEAARTALLASAYEGISKAPWRRRERAFDQPR
jgi:hypothetical protein